MSNDIVRTLAQHYDALVRKHGDAPEASQWSNRDTQFRRFAVLAGIAPDLAASSILDLGCGTGALLTFLNEHVGFSGSYTGIDISPEAIKVARQNHPEARFLHHDLLTDTLDEQFDYVMISGIFNNKLKNEEVCMKYLQDILVRTFGIAKKGVAFNAMSKYVDYEDENLCYFQPEEIFSFCKRRLSSRVTLRHDYRVKDNVIPFEFTVYVYKDKET